MIEGGLGRPMAKVKVFYKGRILNDRFDSSSAGLRSFAWRLGISHWRRDSFQVFHTFSPNWPISLFFSYLRYSLSERTLDDLPPPAEDFSQAGFSLVVVLLAEGYFVGIGNFVWLGSFLGIICVIFIGLRSDHSLPMSVTDWLTDSLTDWQTNLLKMSRPCWRMNELT